MIWTSWRSRSRCFLEQVLCGFFLVEGDEVEVLGFVILAPVHGPLDLDDVSVLWDYNIEN